MNYELKLTFRTARPLTDGEVTDLLNRFGVEIAEPMTTDSDGLPTDAEWSGRGVRMSLIDGEGRQAGSWLW